MSTVLSRIKADYKAVKEACQGGWRSEAARQAIQALVRRSLTFLDEKCSLVRLNSLVEGKRYTAYQRRGSSKVISRPANESFFLCDADEVDRMWHEWRGNKLGSESVGPFLYTVALAPCLAMELFDRQNKKGPATYFECFVGHLIAKATGAEPRKRATLSVEGETVRLTMDFLFDQEEGPSIHVAVKMSTRERVVQAWAHQRLLDSAYGVGAYRGIMVLFGETKLNLKTREVVEICVPDQWLAYQALLSQMERIYYFDPPERYCQLAREHPTLIKLRPFAEFFRETASVLGR